MHQTSLSLWFTYKVNLKKSCDRRMTQSKMSLENIVSVWVMLFPGWTINLLFAASLLFAGLGWLQGDIKTLDAKLTIDKISHADLSIRSSPLFQLHWNIKCLNSRKSGKVLIVRRISEPCWDGRYALAKPQKCKRLNIEQELSLWLYLLQRSGCAQGLVYPFSLWSQFLFFEVAELEQEVRCIIHRSVSVRS